MYRDANNIRQPTVTEFGIYGFFGDYRFLSNFQAAPLVLDGIQYPTSEHAYMAEKVLDFDLRRRIAALPKAADAQRFGQTVPLRDGWDAYRPHAMLRVLRAKFAQNPELAQRLLATGQLYLEESNDWHDTYWGVCNGQGLSMLGKTLMQVRNELYLATPQQRQTSLL